MEKIYKTVIVSLSNGRRANNRSFGVGMVTVPSLGNGRLVTRLYRRWGSVSYPFVRFSLRHRFQNRHQQACDEGLTTVLIFKQVLI